MFTKIENFFRNIVKTELEKFESAAVSDAKIIENDFKEVVAKAKADFEKIVADLKADLKKA